MRVQSESYLYRLLKEEIVCIICFEEMQSPKSLQCLHVFCAACIGRGMAKNGKMKCPNCRSVTKVILLRSKVYVK